MTTDQSLVVAVLAIVVVLLMWGRWRYDVVAFAALIIAVAIGVVPSERAFEGFGHPATIIVALVLIVSRGLTNAGVVQVITRHVVDNGRGLSAHIGIMSSVGAALSAVINNVAALAVLMPVDMKAAEQAGRAPGLTLMPLAFATLLGGLITLIGTPPNIIIANFRQQTTGEPFAMFDFAPVGLVVAAAGVAFIALAGWRLMPAVGGGGETRQESFALDDYIAEVKVPEDADVIGKRVRELDDVAEKSGVAILGLLRGKKRMPGMARRAVIEAGNKLVVEGAPDDIDAFSSELGLSYVEGESEKERLKSSDLGFMEVVAPEGSRIIGRSASDLRLLTRQGVVLLGVSRRGKRFVEQVRRLAIQPGDVLLLYGPVERLPAVADWLGGLRLAGAELRPARAEKSWLAAGIFGFAIALASFELLQLSVALGAVCVAFVATGIVPLRELYEAVEWPVVVLLASLLPIGAALESTGTTGLLAEQIVLLSSGVSAAVLLGVVMVVTVLLSSVMNNTATAVIAAPLAIDIAARLDVNADAFLMGVAVAASASFLTPIAHKNNTLIMGPGGYGFGDYWRLGLPLEVLVLAVAIPMILVVWPL
ncbi:MAG: SLC13 family permease [Dichotomicrobium sp.]